MGNIIISGLCNLSPESKTGPGYNYDTATLLIITFVVNNHVRDEDNKKAMAWEQAMLDYLHDYKKHHTKYIDIEYSTEVCVICMSLFNYL